MDVRNKNGKKVCVVDADNKTVEILFKGSLTKITFLPDGTITVKNE